MNKSEETRIKTNDDVAKSQNYGEQMQVLRNLRS